MNRDTVTAANQILRAIEQATYGRNIIAQEVNKLKVHRLSGIEKNPFRQADLDQLIAGAQVPYDERIKELQAEFEKLGTPEQKPNLGYCPICSLLTDAGPDAPGLA